MRSFARSKLLRAHCQLFLSSVTMKQPEWGEDVLLYNLFRAVLQFLLLLLSFLVLLRILFAFFLSKRFFTILARLDPTAPKACPIISNLPPIGFALCPSKPLAEPPSVPARCCSASNPTGASWWPGAIPLELLQTSAVEGKPATDYPTSACRLARMIDVTMGDFGCYW